MTCYATPEDLSLAMSGVYQGSLIRSSEDGGIEDIDEIAFLVVFCPTDSSNQTYSIQAMSIDYPHYPPAVRKDHVCIFGGICNSTEVQVSSQIGNDTTSFAGEISNNKIILVSSGKEICVRLVDNVSVGVCSLLTSSLWSGTSICKSQISTWGNDIKLDFMTQSDQDETGATIIVKGMLEVDGNAYTLDGLFDVKGSQLKLHRRLLETSTGNEIKNVTYHAVFNPVKLEFDGKGLQSIHLRSSLLKNSPYLSKLPNAIKTAMALISRTAANAKPGSPKRSAIISKKPVPNVKFTSCNEKTATLCISAVGACIETDACSSGCSVVTGPKVTDGAAVATGPEEELEEPLEAAINEDLYNEKNCASYANIIHNLIQRVEESKGRTDGQHFDQIQRETPITDAQHAIAVSLYALLRDDSSATLKDCSRDIVDSMLCRICYGALIDCVLIPCGHLAVCLSCALQLEVCPYDRLTIQKVQPVYRV